MRFTGQRAMVLRSRTGHVHGDEAGRGGGVVSGTCGGICEPIGHAEQVFAEGSPVIRHLDRFWMNDRNTVGEAVFVRDTGVYPAPRVDDPFPGSLRTVEMQAFVGEPYQVAQATTGTMTDAVVGSPFAAPPGVKAPPASAAPQIGTTPSPGPSSPDPGPPGGPRQRRTGLFGTFLRRNLPGFLLDLLLNYPTDRQRGMADELDRVSRNQSLSDEAQAILHDAARRSRAASMPGEASEIRDEAWDRLRELEAEGRLNREPGTRTDVDEDTEPRPVPAPEATGTRVDEEGSQNGCIVGEYSKIKPICKGQAHHIIPDMSYRLGPRPTTTAAKNSTEDRILNAPTFNQGMSICLLSSQHESGEDGLHGRLRIEFEIIGSGLPVPGTAPMDEILEASVSEIYAIRALPEECKALADAMTRAQVMSKTGFEAPGRTMEQPLPSGEAKVVLERGYY